MRAMIVMYIRSRQRVLCVWVMMNCFDDLLEKDVDPSFVVITARNAE